MSAQSTLEQVFRFREVETWFKEEAKENLSAGFSMSPVQADPNMSRIGEGSFEAWALAQNPWVSNSEPASSEKAGSDSMYAKSQVIL